MGETLASACNATLLNDPTLIDLYGTPTLISHGDVLCTDDLEYQKFRKTVQSIDFKQEFLSKPLDERKAYIEQLRRHSETEKKTKNMAVMDVNSDAVAALLREHRYPRLIHGHTHRPARHEHRIDGHLCERWVLSDWDSQPAVLHCDSDGIRFQSIN
jgi:UDP-2,3-diacylglucosamine hydrolase